MIPLLLLACMGPWPEDAVKGAQVWVGPEGRVLGCYEQWHDQLGGGGEYKCDVESADHTRTRLFCTPGCIEGSK